MEHFLEKEHGHHAQDQGLVADPSSDSNQGAETKTLGRKYSVLLPFSERDDLLCLCKASVEKNTAS